MRRDYLQLDFALLLNGSMPLAVLEDVVHEWIREQRSQPAA
jgi:uncharacterized protein (DUF885 family)